MCPGKNYQWEIRDNGGWSEGAVKMGLGALIEIPFFKGQKTKNIFRIINQRHSNVHQRQRVYRLTLTCLTCLTLMHMSFYLGNVFVYLNPLC